MLFNDSIKKHWLEKIESLGDRFDPDCGNRPPKYKGMNAAPLNLLTGLYEDKAVWTDFEKEFQLPKWILKTIDTHMHTVSPTTSKADLKLVIESCPTYKDLELPYHVFNQKILGYLLENFSGLPAELNRNAHYGGIWGLLMTREILKAQRWEVPIQVLVNIQRLREEFQYWGSGSPFEYFSSSTEAMLNQWTPDWPEYFEAFHKLKGETVDHKELGFKVLNMLVSTLKEA